MTNAFDDGPNPSQVEPEPLLAGHPAPEPWTQIPDRSLPGQFPSGSDQPNHYPQGRYPQVPYPQGQYANGPGYHLQFSPVPALKAPKPSPMPDGPREYQHMLRGPRYRWWRPLVGLLLILAIAVPLMVLAFLPVVLAGSVAGIPDPWQWAAREVIDINNLGPAGFFYVNLTLAALIPTAGWTIWLAHRIRPRFVSSVAGGIRWRWLLRCVLVVVPLWAVYLGVSVLLDPPSSPRPAQWWLLLVIVVVLTPLQAAGEEYLFRGWVLQNVGAWFKNPVVALVAGLAVSVVAFSAAHGSADPWILGSLGVFAVSAGVVTWRTGGLEAGIAIHSVNNVGIFFVVVLMGGWEGVFVSGSSSSTPLVFAVDLVVHAVALYLILRQAKQAKIERRYLPPADHPALAAAPLESAARV
jgi:hypothetical protein